MALMKQARKRLRKEYASRGRGDLFEALGGALSEKSLEHSHADVAANLGISEGNVRQSISRMRKRYKEILTEEIAQTVQSEDEIAGELRHLFSAFAR